MKITLEETKTQVEKIRKQIKGKGIDAYVDYVIAEHTFKQNHSESFFENEFNIWFCNGLRSEINKIQLVYSSYEGILSIVPIGDHESYFNINDLDFLDVSEETWTNSIFTLWTKLTQL